jgi:hypothetical protein
MSAKPFRVGGGYSKKCSQCEFSMKENARLALKVQELTPKAQELALKAQELALKAQEASQYKEELSTLRNELDKVIEKNVELEERIKMMIEEKAVEELNVMSKLEHITNLVGGLVTTSTKLHDVVKRTEQDK